MSYNLSNPFPYLHALPQAKLKDGKYFTIFKEFIKLNPLEIMKGLINIIEQKESSIRNYIDMFKSLGIINDDQELTEPFGTTIVQLKDAKQMQFELLYELLNRKWFNYSFFLLFRFLNLQEDIKFKKENLLIFLGKELEKNGFYVQRRKQKNKRTTPNKHRIDGFLNLLYFIEIVDPKTHKINEKILRDFEQNYLKTRLQADQILLEDFLTDNLNRSINEAVTDRSNLGHVNTNDINDFNKLVRTVYSNLNETYVFIADLEVKIDDPDFFDKLYLMHDSGNAYLVPGRPQDTNKTYVKYGRRYSKVVIYK